MAPMKGKRASLRTKIRSRRRCHAAQRAAGRTSEEAPVDLPFSPFPSIKRDKHAMKSSIFRAEVERKHAKDVNSSKSRPSERLVTTLESLADALPDLESQGGADGQGAVEVGQARIGRRSLKTKPGALKRKERLERMERERFGENLARMCTGASQTPQAMSCDGMDASHASQAPQIAERWSSLRNFIESTMEKKKEFVSA